VTAEVRQEELWVSEGIRSFAGKGQKNEMAAQLLRGLIQGGH
jgi:hypothetical protein